MHVCLFYNAQKSLKNRSTFWDNVLLIQIYTTRLETVLVHSINRQTAQK